MSLLPVVVVADQPPLEVAVLVVTELGLDHLYQPQEDLVVMGHIQLLLVVAELLFTQWIPARLYLVIMEVYHYLQIQRIQ
jgi:hypothetical protein